MKRKVHTDGNGSKHILVEGLGEYSPKGDHDRLKADNAELVDMLVFLHKTSDMRSDIYDEVKNLIQKHKEPDND